MIDDYIALSKKRMREDSMVNWNFSVENKALMIPPLLFLPLVENGFKYGIFAQTDSTNLKLSLDQKSDELVFRTENRMPSYLENKQNEGGVGLSNLRKRLERLYPNAYSLDVSENDGVFEVQMTLKLSSCVV
jgi:LytS/YehU family sensor histidine kinase